MDKLEEALNTPGVVLDRWIIRLGKHDGEFEPWHTTADDFQEDLEGFLDALSLTRSVRLTNERMKGQKNAIKAAKKVAKELAAEKEKAEKKAAKALERENKRVAKETAKMEERKAKAQAKLDAKAAKLNGLQIKTVIVDEAKDLTVAHLNLLGVTSGRFDSSKPNQSNTPQDLREFTVRDLKGGDVMTYEGTNLTLKEGDVVTYEGTNLTGSFAVNGVNLVRPSVVLTAPDAVPVEVVAARLKFVLPEEKL